MNFAILIVLVSVAVYSVLKIRNLERHVALLIGRLDLTEEVLSKVCEIPELVCEHGILKTLHCAACVTAAEAHEGGGIGA